MALAFTIRPATEADLDAMSALLVATWHATYDAIYGRERVDDITARWHSVETLRTQLADPNAVMLVAERPPVMLATLRMSRRGEGAAFLDRLYVAPDAQGMGIGRALYEAAGRALGEPAVVTLEVEPANTGAVAFYEHLGFSTVGKVSNCGGSSGVPAVVMRKG